jgi:hypothetical protein
VSKRYYLASQKGRRHISIHSNIMSSFSSPLVANQDGSSSGKIDMEIGVESTQKHSPKLATTKHIVALGLLLFGFSFSYNVAYSIGIAIRSLSLKKT